MTKDQMKRMKSTFSDEIGLQADQNMELFFAYLNLKVNSEINDRLKKIDDRLSIVEAVAKKNLP